MNSEAIDTHEDEIDLRELVHKLGKYKFVILGITLFLALIGGLISLLGPRTYTAAAIVTLYQPTLFSNQGGVGVSSTDVGGSQLQMSLPANGLQAFYSTVRPTANDLADLVTSGDLLSAVLASPEISSKYHDLDLESLQGQMKASPIGNSLVHLQLTQDTPDAAATLANAWATAVAEKLNDSYGISESDVKIVASQVANAQQARDQAEAALSDELMHNQSAALNVQLTEQKAALTGYLDKQNSLSLLATDVQRLQGLLGKAPSSAPLPFDQGLSIISLEQGAVAVNSSAPQLQIPTSGIFGPEYSIGDAQVLLTEFSNSLNQQQSLLDTNVGQVKDQILKTQTTLEQESHRLDQAIQARDATKAQFLTLSMQLQQMQLFRQNAPVAKVTSTALPPKKPDSRRTVANTVAGAAIGLVLSVFGVLAVDWWLKGNRDEAKDSRGNALIPTPAGK